MPASVVHHLNTQQIAILLRSSQGPVAKELLKRGLRVESKAKINLGTDPKRIDSGRLRSSIRANMYIINNKPVCRVGTDVKYARFVHDGTGLYGPHAQRIYPKNGPVLSWKSGGVYVYAKSTKGMRPNPFLKNALSAVKG